MSGDRRPAWLPITLGVVAIALAVGLALRWRPLLDDPYAPLDARLTGRVVTGDGAMATVTLDGRLPASGEQPNAVRRLALHDRAITVAAAATGEALAGGRVRLHAHGEAIAATVRLDAAAAADWPSEPGGGGVRRAVLAAAGGEAAAPRADGSPGPLVLLLDLYERAADAGGLAGLAEQQALEAVFDEAYYERRLAADQAAVTKLLGVLDADDAARVRAALDRPCAIGGAAGSVIDRAKRDAVAAPERAAAFAARVRAVQEAYERDPAGTRQRLWAEARTAALDGDARVVLEAPP